VMSVAGCWVRNQRSEEVWRGLVAYIEGSVQPGDTVMFSLPYGANGFHFYRARVKTQGRERFVDAPDPSNIASLAANGQTLWLVMYPFPHVAEETALLDSGLRHRYRLIGSKLLDGLAVERFDLTQPPFRDHDEAAPPPEGSPR